ncbi:MAG: ATP-binding protein [Patescibacteria group bacterium]
MILAASILLVIIFGILAIAFSIKEEKTRKLLLAQDALQKQKIYQISILKEIQDRIGYSLDVEKVIDVITGSLRNLFPYSTASSAVVKEDKLIFKIYVEETVSRSFIDDVKKSMLASLSALLEHLPNDSDELLSGVPLSQDNNLALASFFHIPLVISNKVVGLINVSSTKPDLYKENEMTILYQITEQASNALSRLEAVLEIEKAKLTSLIRGLADGVFMLDQKGNLIIINDTAKKMLNIQTDNPTLIEAISSIPSQYQMLSKIHDAVAQNKTIEEKEVILGDKTVQVIVSPVAGPLPAVSVLLHDITIEKNLSQVKEDFTNIMVHELRAPITAIKDSAEIIISDKYNLSKDEKNEFLEIINQQSKLLLDQIASILDAAKLEAGKFTIKKAQSDISELIQEEIKTFTPPAAKKHISISSDIPQDLPKFSFDRIRIAQVLNNLLSNSLKFTPEGGKIKIKVTMEDNERGVTRARGLAGTESLVSDNEYQRGGERQDPEHFIKVSVSDTGIGIPKDQQENLFSKFTQADTSSHLTNTQGTGLGLYVVKGIVEAHEGSVSIESPASPSQGGEENQGTTISFTIPIDSPYLSPYQAPHLTIN